MVRRKLQMNKNGGIRTDTESIVALFFILYDSAVLAEDFMAM